MKTLALGFNTTAQDSNPGSRSRECEAVPTAEPLLYKCRVVQLQEASEGSGG